MVLAVVVYPIPVSLLIHINNIRVVLLGYLKVDFTLEIIALKNHLRLKSLVPLNFKVQNKFI